MEKYKVSNKKGKSFKKIITYYIIFLAILTAIFFVYIISTLIKYEKLQINNYLDDTIEKIAKAGNKEDVSKYMNTSEIKVSDFQNKNTSIDEGIAKLLDNKEATYKLNNNSTDLNNPIYDVYIDDELTFNVKLNGEEKITKLGLLTFQNWKTENIEFVKENGIYECNIEVPSNITVYVNNIKLTDNEKTEQVLDEGLEQISKYVDIPHMIKYTIPNLLNQPEIKMEDENGNQVQYSQDGNTFKVRLEFEDIQDQETAMEKIKGNVDIQKIAQDWSLYLTDDLEGSLHGFYAINKYLIKDSDIWNYAYKWATNIDITFISSHRLDNPAFTNVKINNFKIYNENAFSCEVYLEKNMVLTRGGTKIQDDMKEKMYFAYYNGEWKLVNMQSIVNN